MQLKPKLIAGLAGALLVAACDGSSSGDDDVSGIDTFGSDFVAMFNADPNDQPVDAQSIDIAVNLTADPFNP